MPLGVSNKYRLYQVLRFILLYVFLLVVNPIISAFFLLFPFGNLMYCITQRYSFNKQLSEAPVVSF